MSKDLHKDFKNRKIKKTNKFLAAIVFVILRIISGKRKVEYEYDESFKDIRKKQMILLCQHRSKSDFIYAFSGFNRLDVHILVGYQNVFQKGVYTVMKKLGVIAKMLYQPDMQSVRQIMQVVKLGESIAIFPEGIQSTSGSTHPINPGTMSLLKKIKLPVAFCEIEGSYMTQPRYTRDIRKGKIKVRFSKLFDVEDFDKYTVEQLEDMLLSRFKYNEFTDRGENKVAFRGKKPNICGLDNIIYKCPDCNAEGAFEIAGDSMQCTRCGFAVSMDEYCDIHAVNGNLPFNDIDAWYKWQRNEVKKEVQSPDFKMSAKVQLRKINTEKLLDNYSLVVDGEGTLTITNQGLCYNGTQGGEDVELVFDAKDVYSLSMSLDYDMDLYYKNLYYNFNLLENEKQVVKWMLCAEEIHNMYDHVWQEASKKVYNYEN